MAQPARLCGHTDRCKCGFASPAPAGYFNRWASPMRSVVALLLLTALSVAAQDFRPYPRARITAEQWQSYFAEVQAKHQQTERQFPNEHLVVYEDRKNYLSWAFTTPGHPAYPAWVTRQPVEDERGVTIRQIGYFAGDEPEFAKLFKAYLALNDRMREQFKKAEPGK